MTMANESAITGGMFAAAIWSTVTGDTFIPSLAGAAFSVFFRVNDKTERRRFDIRDAFAALSISVVFGLIVGPYFASHLPQGEQVVAVGALIMSFVAMSLLERIYEGGLLEFIARIKSAFLGDPRK